MTNGKALQTHRNELNEGIENAKIIRQGVNINQMSYLSFKI